MFIESGEGKWSAPSGREDILETGDMRSERILEGSIYKRFVPTELVSGCRRRTSSISLFLGQLGATQLPFSSPMQRSSGAWRKWNRDQAIASINCLRADGKGWLSGR
jgi:hypothetical protein